MEGNTIGIILVLLFTLAIYFLPWMIASHRGHNSSGSIFIVNLFLGWTFLVWVICLAWAFGGNTRERDERIARAARGEDG